MSERVTLHPAFPDVAQELLSRVGQVREWLSAVRNLEHLLGSVQAGPKVLEALILEILQVAPAMEQEISGVLAAVTRARQLAAELNELGTFASAKVAELAAALEAGKGAMTAKRRLQLERGLRPLSPFLPTLVEHLELLAESVARQGVTLPLLELLSSRPGHGSSRPLRRLTVLGPAQEIEVRVPPRAALSALCLLAEVTQRGGSPTVVVGLTEAGRAELHFLPPGAERPVGAAQTCQIPLLGTFAPSFGVARAVLVGLGAHFADESVARFTLPIAH